MTILHGPDSSIAPKSGVLLVLADLTDAIESRETHLAKLEEYTTRIEREREEALQEAGRLRARVEQVDALLAEAPRLVAEAARLIDAIMGDGDPEGAHGEADEVLLAFVPPEIREAYQRLVKRAQWWAAA